jgi:N-acetylmuramoyl-L-alanine amidase
VPKVQRVKQGDCISSIAHVHGFLPETIWRDAANASLRKVRADPDILYPGDEITIPDKCAKEESAGTDQRHRFRRRGVPACLRLRLVDHEYNPRKDVEYRLEIDGESRTGVTDGDGRIEEPIPPSAIRAVLVIDSDQRHEEYEIPLGYVDPPSEIEGVQQRLKNLGLDCGAVDGNMGERTTAALKQFQRLHGFEPTGRLDDSTRNELESVHGS